MRRPFPAVALAVVVLAGCNGDDEAIDSLPPPTDGSGSTVASTTSVTTVPTTADASTTTSSTTTTSSPTTTTAASTTTTTTAPVPSDQAAAVLIGGDAGNWLPIGWWSGTGWVEAGGEGATEVPAAPGDDVTIVQLGGTGAAELGALDEACQDGRNGFAVPGAGVPAPEPPGFGYSAIAVNAPWPVQPRPAVEAGAAVEEYERIAEDLASGLGVDPAPGDVAQVVRVDLDGDGIEEVVVAFEYVQESLIGAVGDLSVVYARLPEADGSVRDQLLLSAAVTPDMQDFPVSDRFRVLGAADLNGDGVMELLVRSWYYEGAGVTAFELRGDELVEVLVGGCGS